jgi:nucleoside-diphosphate-sugar epimerase
MKTLVTGASNFMGASIIRELIKDGFVVKVLVRKDSNIKNIDGLDLEKAYGDICDKESVKAALKDCDTCYHTAALFANWVPDNKMFYDINVEGTKNFLRATDERRLFRHSQIVMLIYLSKYLDICHFMRAFQYIDARLFNVPMSSNLHGYSHFPETS